MKRKTQCFSYGEERRQHVTAAARDGGRICITVGQERTACGRWVDYGSEERLCSVPDFRLYDTGWSRRPAGVCRGCWHDWRRYHLIEAEAQGFDRADVYRKYRYVFEDRGPIEAEATP